MRKIIIVGAAISTILMGSSSMAQTTPPMDFYAGKRIDFYISTTTGGGYDVTGRHIARHLGRNIPGNPTVTPRNLPGGGGLIMANHLTNIAAKDGLSIGIVLSSAPFEPLYGNKEAKFDPARLNWLGSPSKDVAALLVWHEVKVETLEDAQRVGLTLAVSGGLNSTPAFFGRLLSHIFDLKVKLVAGYPGQNEAFLAMERGEVQGFPSVSLSSLKSSRPHWLQEKKVKPLVYFGGAENAAFVNVPFAASLLKSNPAKAVLMELGIAPLAVGRPVFAPPDIPMERADILRAAMWKTFVDPEYLSECEKQNLECDSPTSGEDLSKIIFEAYAAPSYLVDKINAINTAQ
jgi:tripartite-type tricarboxylate transporter receptor subunit TctC